MRYPEFLKDKGTIGFIAPSFGESTMPYSACFDRTIKIVKEMGYSVLEGPNTRLGEGIGKSNTPEKCGAEIREYIFDAPLVLSAADLVLCSSNSPSSRTFAPPAFSISRAFFS